MLVHTLTVNGHANLEEKSYLSKNHILELEWVWFYMLIFVYSCTVPLNVRAALTLGNLDLVKIQFLPFAHSF